MQRELREGKCTERRRTLAGFRIRIQNEQRRGKNVICVFWAFLLPNPALFSPPRTLCPCARTPLAHPTPVDRPTLANTARSHHPELARTSTTHPTREGTPQCSCRPLEPPIQSCLCACPTLAAPAHPTVESRQLLPPGIRAETSWRMSGTAPSTMPTQKLHGRLEATSPDRRPRGVRAGAVKQTRKTCCRSQPNRRSWDSIGWLHLAVVWRRARPLRASLSDHAARQSLGQACAVAVRHFLYWSHSGRLLIRPSLRPEIVAASRGSRPMSWQGRDQLSDGETAIDGGQRWGRSRAAES